MPKRACTTANEVVKIWDESSDDEFSDLEDVGKDELEHSAAPSASVPPSVFDSSMDSDSDTHLIAAASDHWWTLTSKLKRNTNSFTSPVDPAVTISKSPLDVFQQLLYRRQMIMPNK